MYTISFFYRIAGWAGLAGMAAAICGVGRIAWADWVRRENTEESVRAAIRLVPENWNYYRDLAELKPYSETGALQRAVELNPRGAPLRIYLGEYAELAGDLTTAEESFASAVALDRTYAPRMEQAGFYYRRRDAGRFLTAARAALEVAREDVRQVLEQCWDLIGDEETILREAIPDRQEILRQYLVYLMDTNRLTAAGTVAKKVMDGDRNGDEAREAILRYCDLTLAAGDEEEAVAAWNWLAGRRLVGYPKKAGAALVTNPAFGAETMNRGFDWRYADGGGLYYEKNRRGGLKVLFSGKQAENSEVLWQYVVLKGAGKYRLRVKYRTPRVDSGLRWEVLAGGRDLLEGKGVLSQAGAGERTFEFEGPPGLPSHTLLGRLLLRCERVRGTVRVAGEAEILSVELMAIG